ncbi:MAG: hypothetical protein AAF717_04595 [Bacteroidota bacterium]
MLQPLGGNFLNNKGWDRTNWGGSEHLCAYTDWSCLNEERNLMCRYVIENCPAPFMASGWENGNGDYLNANNGYVMTGQGLKQLPEDHIIRVGYEKYFEYRRGAHNITRHSNDQCALYYAIRGEGENYTAITNGTITLTEKGVCSWEATEDVDKGSWVVAYNFYRDSTFVHQAYGTKYVLGKVSGAYEIKAVNASGTLSAPIHFHVK